MAHVDERDGADQLGMGSAEEDRRQAAHRSPDQHRGLEAEGLQDGWQGLGIRARPVLVQRVRIPVVRQIDGQDVVAPGQRRAQILEHVRGLAAAMEAEHGRQPAVAPLQVVNLATLDQRVAAAPSARHVVARDPTRLGMLGRLTHGVNPNPSPPSRSHSPTFASQASKPLPLVLLIARVPQVTISHSRSSASKAATMASSFSSGGGFSSPSSYSRSSISYLLSPKR